MRRYNLINNVLGWLCFLVASITYLLTLEPTASFWDCSEYIIQGQNLEIGHPPGNPIWMLAARFFINFAGGNPANSAIAVNVMSALFSAATILLLFWTITHLVKRLIVRDDEQEIPLPRMLVIFGSGLCGALAYTWSDTFWFSAVEGEVYAFSSFCTALVFWLILKWESRADNPSSDRYLMLIAYIMGVSVGVHLLNLLCIPAIILVIYYRKFSNATATGSLIALAVSFVIVGLLLYGLVPGFLEIAQYFELFAVNILGMGYNSGAIVYVVTLVAIFLWAIYELYAQRNVLRIKISLTLSVLISGIPFIGNSLWIPIVFMLGLIAYLFMCKRLHIRILSISIVSMFVIFIGYSSYTLILIRANAHPPMNQNAPDNVFSLASYIGRDQYGGNGLFYDVTFADSIVTKPDGTKVFKNVLPYLRDENGEAIKTIGKPLYAKTVKDLSTEPDHYVIKGYETDYEMIPELKVPFPRLNSTTLIDVVRYKEAMDYHTTTDSRKQLVTTHINSDGSKRMAEVYAPSYWDNIAYFLNYQLGYMYWRYFMWNFAGRQNDLKGGGELNRGNWISGFSMIDDARLGNQSLLPKEFGEGNKGHNVYYMLPLLLGIIGLLWQAYVSQRGIEQFWVVAFLFFMTGIAIILYLNQTVGQPRERDYAYSGSFYAFAIWMGFGVVAIWSMLKSAIEYITKKIKREITAISYIPVAIASIVGVAIPLQMVSQTWDDHDRTGRYMARDYGFNYLSSLDENAIILTEGDNELFPLWYAQEVEGYRQDVKVVNLSYLSSDWYVNELRYPSYNAPSVDIFAKPNVYAYGRMSRLFFPQYYGMSECVDSAGIDAVTALRNIYRDSTMHESGKRLFPYMSVYIPYNQHAGVESGFITEEEVLRATNKIRLNLTGTSEKRTFFNLKDLMVLDMITRSATNGFNRPIYFALPADEKYHLGMTPYLRSTGMVYELTPFYNSSYSQDSIVAVDTEKMYHNITEHYRWGGMDLIKNGDEVYIDETVKNMIHTMRLSMYNLASALWRESERYSNSSYKQERYEKIRVILGLMAEKLPPSVIEYRICFASKLAELYIKLGSPDDLSKARELIASEISRYSEYVNYLNSLSDRQRGIIRRGDWDAIPEIVYLSKLYVEAGGDVAQLLKSQREVNFAVMPALLDDYDERYSVEKGELDSKGEAIKQYRPEFERLLKSI